MSEQPTCGAHVVKVKCCVCGEMKSDASCFSLAAGWLCVDCDVAGRVWAARMARNPVLVHVASISNSDTDKPLTVEADRG